MMVQITATALQHVVPDLRPIGERMPDFRTVVEGRRAGVTVVLENCRKENLGLIARTAEALGIATVYAIYSPDMAPHLRGFQELSDATKAAQLGRISRSATDWIDIRTFDTTATCLEALRDDGFDTFIATTPEQHATTALYHEENDWALRRPALFFGTEAKGLSAEVMRNADVNVTVPMRGMSQSLNVAAGASIVLSECLRRRDQANIDDPLDQESQDRILNRFHPGDSPPLRLHNKAFVKHQSLREKKQFQQEILMDEQPPPSR